MATASARKLWPRRSTSFRPQAHALTSKPSKYLKNNNGFKNPVFFLLKVFLAPILIGVAYAILLSSDAVDASIAWQGVNVTITGNTYVNGGLAKGSGSFVIDHPLDPANKLLYHSFVESPDVKNIYDGVVTLNALGEVTITLPNYFEALNRDFRYQYSAYGTPAPNLYIKSEIKNNRFTIAGGPSGARVSWQVTGIRHDSYILEHPIIVEVEKGPDALANKGEYLFTGYADKAEAVGDSIKQKLAALWNWFIGLFQ